jgi:Fe-S-cluster-containing hydrogenase component 2
MPVEINGYPDVEEVINDVNYPSAERQAKGRYIVIECFQEIPCNPCETVCNRKAIKVGSPITNLPVYIAEECNGCGVCIAACPGQAIFMIDKTFAEDRELVGFPYEYCPLPEVGQTVPAVNRAGEVVCEGRIEKVLTSKALDKTNVIHLSVPIGMADIVRSIRYRKPAEYEHTANVKAIEAASDNDKVENPEDVIICRCEEVSLKDVLDAIKDGARDVRGVKIRTRAGMGLCQGKSCEKQIQRIIATECGLAPENVVPDK